MPSLFINAAAVPFGGGKPRGAAEGQKARSAAEKNIIAGALHTANNSPFDSAGTKLP
jgi:hypothetical protein